MMNLLEGAALFAGMVAKYEEAKHKALEKACVIIETEAKHVLGTYEYGWPPLAPATVARKANGDTPLIETGEMRDSIEHTVRGDSGFVGSDSDIAVYQELGTSRIPPRSFLGGAAMHKGKEAAHAIGQEIVTSLIGKAV
jgi:hypothetical protein